MAITLTPLEITRFRQKVSIDPETSCHNWTGCRHRDGYGKVMLRQVQYRAHRLIFTHANGEIPTGMLVRHKCDNPSCVNPAHLEVGTDADNGADKAIRGRVPKIIDDDAVRDIRRSEQKGIRLAEKYGISRSAVSLIRARKSRKHVGG